MEPFQGSGSCPKVIRISRATLSACNTDWPDASSVTPSKDRKATRPPPALNWSVTGPGPEPRCNASTPSEAGSSGGSSSHRATETLTNLSRAPRVHRSRETKRD